MTCGAAVTLGDYIGIFRSDKILLEECANLAKIEAEESLRTNDLNAK